MAKNTIIMIGDGMGWEMARAAAIYKQMREGKTGATLADFYTEGKGSGLSFQNLTGYGLVTTYGTTIAPGSEVADPTKRTFSTGNSATIGDAPTGENPIRTGFEFVPEFDAGINSSGGTLNTETNAVGKLVGYDPVKGGSLPWDSDYYTNSAYNGGTQDAGFDKKYIQNSYPDSANTATTLYTGVKSYNNAISVDIFEQPLETILETAAMGGKSTGIVSSVPIDHATPGAAAANVNRRNKYDADFPNLDNILQQELRVFQPTVILGGGHPDSNTKAPLPNGVEPDYTYIKPSTYNELSNNPNSNIYGYTFLERGANAAEVLAQTAATIDPEKGGRLLGLYGARGQNGNLPVSSANGDYSTTGLDMFSNFSTQGLNPDTVRPLLPGETDASFIARERNENPTLQNLTTAALDVLGKDPDGFWLMVEGGDIDWSAHDNNIDNLIGTMLDFDKSVESTINWIEQNGGWENNQLVVTADHDHYLTLNGDFPTLLSTKGAEALTADDTVAGSGNYWGSTPETTKYGWGNHTNRPVPVYYQGPDSAVLDASVGQGYESYGFDIPGVAGLVDQSHIYQTMLAGVTEENEKELVSGTSEADTLIAGVTANFDGVRDTVFTGAGNDEVDAIFNTNARQNRVNAGSGDDIIYVSRRDRVFGSAGNDEFDATDAKGGNRMSGGEGDDIFYLGMDDRALGGAGNDIFYVQSGGGNILSGGEGADQFWIVNAEINAEIPESMNTIVDFEMGTDVIGISGSVGISGFADLTLTEVGGNTQIAFGGDALAMVNGVTGLGETSFAFSAQSQVG